MEGLDALFSRSAMILCAWSKLQLEKNDWIEAMVPSATRIAKSTEQGVLRIHNSLGIPTL